MATAPTCSSGGDGVPAVFPVGFAMSGSTGVTTEDAGSAASAGLGDPAWSETDGLVVPCSSGAGDMVTESGAAVGTGGAGVPIEVGASVVCAAMGTAVGAAEGITTAAVGVGVGRGSVVEGGAMVYMLILTELVVVGGSGVGMTELVVVVGGSGVGGSGVGTGGAGVGTGGAGVALNNRVNAGTGVGNTEFAGGNPTEAFAVVTAGAADVVDSGGAETTGCSVVFIDTPFVPIIIIGIMHPTSLLKSF